MSWQQESNQDMDVSKISFKEPKILAVEEWGYKYRKEAYRNLSNVPNVPNVTNVPNAPRAEL